VDACAFTQRNIILFHREKLEAHLDNPQWIEDLVVHELMHFKVPRHVDGGKSHGRKYRRAMVAYGFHPQALGWRE